ncbi:DUF3592 domain-containing protein [Solirubrum puertoriconensis]|uniref:DUF3592 domain-containing protein n=1 Tax=Solirubrum puertoriconensis TaxID=1751427 RepID=A0A9X0L5E1_SOLP1|nr:DUF3592 domain-containing protein [Solirubrum puertoriconensis]KUG08598.1 hypothetical protein ASU33_10635 [Solirubrum puertoriconensis]
MPIIYGFALRQRHQRLCQHGHFTTGLVVDHDEGPIVEFHTEAGHLVRIKPETGGKSYFARGAVVSLYYNPGDPQHNFALADYYLLNARPLVFIGIGIILILAGLFAPIGS